MHRTLIIALFGCIVAAVLLRESALRSALLRSDPNLTTSSPALLAFAQPRGERLFEAHCASCHGLRGLGDPQKGVPNLSDDDWLYGTGQVSDIEQVVLYGIRSYHPKAWNLAIMPAFATAQPSARDSKIPPLSPHDIRDVVEFLIFRQGLRADEGAVVRGAALYSGSGGCYDCHGVDAQGDSAIGAPNLVDRITLYGDGSRRSLSGSIAQGRAGICPAWSGRLTAAEIRELAVFVHTLSHHGDP